MTALPLIVGLLLLLQLPFQPIERRNDGSFAGMLVQKSTDVPRLETLVRAPDSLSDIRKSDILRRLTRDIRVMAYARLGELGTPAAMAALARLDDEILANAGVAATAPAGEWTHPAWHVGSRDPEHLVEVDTPRGRVALVAEGIMGGSDAFLMSNRTPENAASWTRPRLTPLRWHWHNRDVSAIVENGSILRVQFVRDPTRDGTVHAQPDESARPITERLELTAIERDSDGDGWTDLEEARLGLLPRDRDTDKDGIPDGDDSCPALAPANETVHGDAAEILRRAAFAVFAVGGSRHLLLIDDSSPRVVVRGYAGPILFGVRESEWREKHGSGGVFINWRIVKQTADEAVVEIADFEGPLSAGGQQVWLNKRDGKWVVIARQTTWVS